MSSWSPEYDISVSDSEDESEQILKNVTGRECIIFLVDANLYKNPELLENALRILRSSFLSGLLVNDKDLIALIFVNTEHSPEPCETSCLENIVVPDKCAIILPPRQLNAAVVQSFLNLVEATPTQFGEIYGALPEGNRCNFAHVLRLCMDLVQHCTYLINNTTIVFLTDNELPHPLHSEGYIQVLQKAADLKNKDVEFHLIPMIDCFNYDTFYKEFICLIRDIDIDCFQPTDPRRLQEMLANRKFKQHYVRRSLGHFNLTLGPNLKLSAQYFNYYTKAKKPNKLLLQRTDSAIVHKHRITQVRKQSDLDPGTNTEVRDINIKNAWYEINLGCENLRLSYEQVNRIRNIHAPGMFLLGFKPKSHLKYAIYSKAANFMYPDDYHIVGSKRLFRALWQRCIEKQKIAICLFMCKRKSMPRYVALVPIDDTAASQDTLSIMSNGFKIVYLSCYSNIRHFNLNEWNCIGNQASDDELKVCEKMMKKFRLDYKPDIVCDPILDNLQSKLLSLAFNVSYESLGSKYFPNPKDQNLRINAILPKFMEIFGEETSAFKRSLENGNSKDGEKRLKKTLDASDKNCVMQMIKNKNLISFSKDQLIQILNEHFNTKVAKTKKKQELIDLIYDI